MFWSEPDVAEEDDEEEALLCSPALMARRASESWIVAPPVEVQFILPKLITMLIIIIFIYHTNSIVCLFPIFFNVII